MEVLRFIEGLRNPVLDALFSIVTHLGEETFFILLGVIFFWCVNKKQGYYLLSIGFIGTLINQFLKLTFRIPRPWVKDESFTIVESARAEATGYSFPSGHTQSSVGIFGGIARANNNKIVRIICIVLCVLVPFSRLYLGVHTPLDVGVSIAVALILIFGLYPLINKTKDSDKGLHILIIAMVVLSVAYMLFVHLYNFPSDIDAHNFESGMNNAYKILGCSLGLLLTFELDRKFIKFDTKATLLGQVLKLVLGLIPVVLIKTFLKQPLIAICGDAYIANAIRYFLLTSFAGCVWPLTFKCFSKLKIKK